MTDPLVPTDLRRRHAQTIRDGSSSYKIDYVIVIKHILNPKGHQNPISGSKVTAILLKGWILPIGGASAGEGQHLQPAHQAYLFLRGVVHCLEIMILLSVVPFDFAVCSPL